jgi:exopolysaccharide biosynthesis polyprenyl glycosylphosphotransferase
MQIHQLMDACLFALAFWLAYAIRTSPNVMDLFDLHPIGEFGAYVRLYLVLIPAAPLVLEAQGFYNRPMFCARRVTAWLLAKSCGFTVLGLIIVTFFFQLSNDIARGVIVLFGFVSFGLVMAKEEVLRRRLERKIAQTGYRRRIILVGAHDEIVKMRAELDTKSRHELEVLAELDLNADSLTKLVNMLHEHSVNGVIIGTRHSYFEEVESLLHACELEGVEAWLMADFFKTQICRTSFDDFYGHPVLVFRTTPDASWQSVFKQLLDHTGALFLMLGLAPFFLAICILVKLSSKGPVLFRQQRSGLNGQPFTIYKFRTMVSNAEQLKHELEAMNEMTGPVFKITKDPRVTPIGRWLRKFSLDELPQLINVIRGEMSLVGPRPLPVDEVKRFHDLAHRRRLSVKPGLTCLWQISGRNNVADFRDWVRLDLEYIDNWSLWLDLKILFRTIPVVLTGFGAK